MLYFYILLELSQNKINAMKQIYLKKYLTTILVLLASITSYASITAGFTVSYTPRCGSALVSFTNTSTSSASITSAVWSWGDSPLTTTSTTSSSVTHLFSSPGTYCVKLVVTNSLGQRDSFQLAPPNCIVVYANPTPSFVITPTYSCSLPATFTITNTSTPGCGTFASTSIQPEGDSIYTSSSFSTTYSSAGNYDLTYYMRNSCGCAVSGTLNDTMHAVAGVRANFTTSSLTSCSSPLVVTFTSTSSGSPTTFLWDTNNDSIYGGGGDAPSGSSTTRTYTASGTYTIGLVVRNAAGCADTIRIPITVSITTVPVTSFTYTSSPGCGVICINATAVGGGTGFSWTISPSTTSPASGSGSPFTFCASTAGTYNVTLRTDFGGCTDDTVRSITIGSITPPPVAVAGVTGCLESCVGPVCVTYNSTGSTPASGSGSPPASYAWTFPSGSPATASGPGPHTICYGSSSTTSLTAALGTLTITTSAGCTNSRTVPGNVRIIDYTNSVVRTGLTRGCLPIIDTFLDNTTVNACDSVASRSWTFGLGRTPVFTSTLKNPVITFPDTGCYDVRLVTVTGRGCRDTTNYPKMICAGDTPVVTVSVTPTDMCFEDTGVTITITGRSDSIRTVWGDFFTNTLLGDTISHSFTHIYTDTGDFVPIVRSFLYGCGPRITFADTIKIRGPIANFADSTVCPSSLTKYFKNQSLGDSTMRAFWDFGVLGSVTDTSSVFNPTFVFPDTGCFNVTLSVTSAITSCTHSKTIQVCIRNVTTDFTLSANDVCSGTIVTYTNTSSSIRPGNSTRWYFMATAATVTTPWTGSTFGPISRISSANLSCLRYVIMQYYDGYGCLRELTKPDFLNMRVLTAKMGSDIRVGCGPLRVCFFDSSTTTCTNITRRRWDFGDSLSVSDTSAATNPCFTFGRTGDYSVTLTIWDSLGCSKTTSPRVIRVINPVADFNIDTLVCLGNPVRVTSNASGYKPIYAWTFPGATSTSAANLRTLGDLTYSAVGTYTVSLTVTDSLGCDSFMSKTVRVYQPKANFGTSDTFFNCDGGVIYFYDSSYTNICSWDWDFGDGTIHSSLRNPTHFYLIPGLYTIKLIVRTCDGCVDSISKPNYIFIKGPTGSFTFSPATMCVGDSVTVTVRSTNTTEYYWLPGRGYSPPPRVVHSPAPPADSTVTDVFRFAYYFPTAPTRDTGRFVPQLYLIDSQGCAVVINPGLTITIDSLWLKFGSSPSLVCDTGTVCFYDSSIYLVSGLRPTTYNWDFGDGSARGTTANVCHKYTAPGTYRVRLYGYNPSGVCGDSIVKMITIRRKPRANFLRSDSLQCVSEPAIAFTDLSSADTFIARRFWQFDRPGLSSSSLTNPSFNYTAAGVFNVKLTVTDTLGCVDSISKFITIVADPIANAGRDTTICYGSSTRLTGSGGRTYLWSPSTRLSSTTVSNPLATPDSTTTYVLQVTDTAGCISRDTVTIFVSRVIGAFAKDTVCLGDTTHFTDLSSTNIGTLTSWSWNFADPPTSILRNPTHLYGSSGIYNVSLRTTNSLGCFDDTIIPAQVLLLPIANFRANAPCVGDSARFTDLSTSPSGGTIVSWSWDFGVAGSGDVSSLQNPVFYYTAPGTYSVRLTARNAGCSKDTSISVQVFAKPFANFRVDTACVYSNNLFTNFSTAIGSSIRSYSWLFDTSSVVINDTSSVSNPSYTYNVSSYGYPAPSTTHYTQLVVTDTHGCKDDTLVRAVVVALPVASFNGDTLCLRDTMRFFDASRSGVGSITSWSWDFGDPATASDISSARNPTYLYTNPGIYSVRLTVTDRFGCTDDTIIPVQVLLLPIANFRANAACVGDSTRFVDLSTSPSGGSITSWSWDFGVAGSGDVSSLQNPVFYYSAPGTYSVRLTVLTGSCTKDTFISVRVYSNPVANFRVDTACAYSNNNFTNLSTAVGSSIRSYSWLFDTSSLVINDTSSITNPTYAYSISSYGYPTPSTIHYARLVVTDTNGCEDDTLARAVVVALPQASFNSDTLCPRDTMRFFDASTSGVGIVTGWSWDFGDPATSSDVSSLRNPTYIYTIPGTYAVRLSVTDRLGCTDDTIINIIVERKPTANFITDSACLGDSIRLTDVSTANSGTIVSWNWDFSTPPSSSLQNPAYLYNTTGPHLVTLTVTTNFGCKEDTSINAYVFAKPTARFTIDSVCLGDSNHVRSIAIAGTYPITSYKWVLTPADTAYTPNASYLYPTAGPHNVRLIVTDVFGCTDDTANSNLYTFTLPTADFSFSGGCGSLPVNFNSTISINGDGGPINRWDWYFDPGVGTVQNPSWSYPDLILHNVQLVVRDIRGCVDTVVKPAGANQLPTANFNLAPSSRVCLGTPFCFTDSSTFTGAPINSWAWDYTGELITDDTTKNPCHTYPVSGNYIITLTVTDTIGCLDTARIAVTVSQPPVANFDADTTCENSPMQFTDRSIPGSAVINSWNWSFYGPTPTGDFIQNPIKVYTDSGGKDVQLIVMDANGCSDTVLKTVWVDWQTAIIAYNDTSVCEGNTVTLLATGGTYYIWTPATFLNRDDSSYVVSAPSTSIAYTVTTLGPYRVCPPTSQVITIQVLPAMPLDVTARPDSILLGSTSQLTAYPGGRIDSIRWYPASTLDCYDCIEPVARPESTTTYMATVYYSMINAYCYSRDSVTVNVYTQCGKDNVYIPNTFTPNGDGKNDAFYPRGYGLEDITIFRVFDRWGNLLYEAKNIISNDKNTAWYGTDLRGKNVDTGVYVYYIEGYCTNNEKVTYSGNISLIR